MGREEGSSLAVETRAGPSGPRLLHRLSLDLDARAEPSDHDFVDYKS